MFFVPFMVVAAKAATATAIIRAFATGITAGTAIAALTEKDSKKSKNFIRR